MWGLDLRSDHAVGPTTNIDQIALFSLIHASGSLQGDLVGHTRSTQHGSITLKVAHDPFTESLDQIHHPVDHGVPQFQILPTLSTSRLCLHENPIPILITYWDSRENITNSSTTVINKDLHDSDDSTTI